MDYCKAIIEIASEAIFLESRSYSCY